MVDPIKKILLKHPSNAFINQRNINEQYLELNYLAAPNFNSAISDYEIFVDLLKSFDIEIHYLPKDKSTSLDSIYTHVCNLFNVYCTEVPCSDVGSDGPKNLSS